MGANGKHAPPSLSELEPIQYERLYHEDDVPLADVRENTLRQLVYVGAGVTVLFLILGFTVPISRQLSFPVVMKGTSQEEIYRFLDAVVLEEKFVHLGDTVEAGAPLVRISSPDIAALAAAYLSAQGKDSLFATDGRFMMEQQSAALKLEAAKYDERIREARKQKAIGWGLYSDDLTKLRFQVEEAEKNYKRELSLYNQKLISETELTAVKEAKILAEYNLNAAKHRRQSEVAQLDAEMRVLDIEKAATLKRVAEKEKEATAEASQRQTEKELSYQQLRATYGDMDLKNGSLILRAKFKGTVSFLLDADKEVSAGAMLLRLRRDTFGVYAYGAISPEFIGMIKSGESAVLKVATFPHYEWGTVSGEIRAVSATPDEKGNYPFEVALTDTSNLSRRLQIGMTGTASVIVDSKSFFGVIFETFRKGYAEITE